LVISFWREFCRALEFLERDPLITLSLLLNEPYLVPCAPRETPMIVSSFLENAFELPATSNASSSLNPSLILFLTICLCLWPMGFFGRAGQAPERGPTGYPVLPPNPHFLFYCQSLRLADQLRINFLPLLMIPNGSVRATGYRIVLHWLLVFLCIVPFLWSLSPFWGLHNN